MHADSRYLAGRAERRPPSVRVNPCHRQRRALLRQVATRPGPRTAIRNPAAYECRTPVRPGHPRHTSFAALCEDVAYHSDHVPKAGQSPRSTARAARASFARPFYADHPLRSCRGPQASTTAHGRSNLPAEYGPVMELLPRLIGGARAAGTAACPSRKFLTDEPMPSPCPPPRRARRGSRRGRAPIAWYLITRVSPEALARPSARLSSTSTDDVGASGARPNAPDERPIGQAARLQRKPIRRLPRQAPAEWSGEQQLIKGVGAQLPCTSPSRSSGRPNAQRPGWARNGLSGPPPTRRGAPGEAITAGSGFVLGS